MIDVIALTNAMVATLQRIGPLTALLDEGAAGIVGYVDENPTRNSARKAVYQMPAGSLLVLWSGTTMEARTESMEAWVHLLQIYVKAQRGRSALEILSALVDGVPVPGDGLRWRYCPLMDGVLPTSVRDIIREPDEEGIDYFVVNSTTQETGDI